VRDLVLPGVAEPVGLPRWHENGLARTRSDGAAAQAKAHPTRDDGEALLLQGMDVAGRDVSARWQEEVEGEQPAAGLGSALADDDPLAADRVVDHPPFNHRVTSGHWVSSEHGVHR
jgi:hypothetical protein